MFNLPPLPRTLRACEEDLRSKDPAIRLAAATDLARLPDVAERAARVALLRAALADPESKVRRRVLLSLADLSAQEAVPELLRLLREPNIELRQMAVLALGECADPSDELVRGRLAALLRAGDPAIRYQALLALSSLHPQGAAADLAQAGEDEDPEVRELAVRLVDEQLLACKLPLSKELEQRLVALCGDAMPAVALVAQLVCAELGWTTPRSMIEAVVRGEFRVKEPRDEQWAIELAGRLRMEQLLPALRRRAYGVLFFSWDPFRWAALSALAQHADPRALSRLMKALASGSYVERTFAAQGLAAVEHEPALPLLRKMLGRAEVVDQDVLREAVQNLSTKSPRLVVD